MSTAARRNSREVILDAAESIVLEAGAAHLTLDAAAERAGVSKGGLLYNFPTKEALLQAMIARHIDRCVQREADTLENLPAGPGRELRAIVLSALDEPGCASAKRVGCALMAAGANDPKLLEPVRQMHQRRLAQLQACAAAGLRFERVAALSLAVNGLFLTEMMQISPYDAEQRRRIVAGLLEMIDEEAARMTADCPPSSLDKLS